MPQQVYQQAVPQQAYAQQAVPQQGAYVYQQQPVQMMAVQAQGVPMQRSGQQQFQTAVPLSSLNRAPAPVDCPSCGQRALTVTNLEVGNTNQ
jgi:hypothetical protein